MIYYSKITTKHTKEKAIKLFKLNKIQVSSVIFDEESTTKTGDSIYLNVKEKILKTDKSLTIDVINSIGKNNREIANELKWMVDNKVKLVVLDISQSKIKGVNASLFLYEVYKKLAEVEIENVKKAQRAGIDIALKEKRRYGRPQIEYPNNWEELYDKWKKKTIYSSEFIKQSGLKRPTFYNMLKKYMTEIGDFESEDCNKDVKVKVS